MIYFAHLDDFSVQLHMLELFLLIVIYILYFLYTSDILCYVDRMTCFSLFLFLKNLAHEIGKS